MYHKFEKMLKMKKGNNDEMDGVEKEAKMSVLESLRQAALDEMGDKLKSIKKVTVASNSGEGLKKGLDKAKDILEKQEGESPEHEASESPEEEKLEHDHEGLESPEEESSEHERHDDIEEPTQLEDEEHEAESEGYLEGPEAEKSEEEAHDEMNHAAEDEEDIDSKIQRLMEIKNRLKRK